LIILDVIKFLSRLLSFSVEQKIGSLVHFLSQTDVVANLAVSLGKFVLVLNPFLNVACNIGLVRAIERALSIFTSLVLSFPREITVEIELLCT